MAERKKSASTKRAKRSAGSAKKSSWRSNSSIARSTGSSSGASRSGSKTNSRTSGLKKTSRKTGTKSSGSSTKAKNLKKGAEKRLTELSGKRKRQYKHVLDSEKKEGRPVKAAKRIAMATVNKTRSKKGETKKIKRS